MQRFMAREPLRFSNDAVGWRPGGFFSLDGDGGCVFVPLDKYRERLPL